MILTREWSTWLELAGRIRSGQTDEARRLKEELTAEFTERQQALEADYQRQMADLRNSFQEEVRTQLADRLYQLARSGQKNTLADAAVGQQDSTL